MGVGCIRMDWMRQGRFLNPDAMDSPRATEATRDARRDYVDVCLLIRALLEVTPLILYSLVVLQNR